MEEVAAVQAKFLHPFVFLNSEHWASDPECSEYCRIRLLKSVSPGLEYRLQVMDGRRELETFVLNKIKQYLIRSNTWHELTTKNKTIALHLLKSDDNFKSFNIHLEIALKSVGKYPKSKAPRLDDQSFLNAIKVFNAKHLKSCNLKSVFSFSRTKEKQKPTGRVRPLPAVPADARKVGEEEEEEKEEDQELFPSLPRSRPPPPEDTTYNYVTTRDIPAPPDHAPPRRRVTDNQLTHSGSPSSNVTPDNKPCPPNKIQTLPTTSSKPTLPSRPRSASNGSGPKNDPQDSNEDQNQLSTVASDRSELQTALNIPPPPLEAPPRMKKKALKNEFLENQSNDPPNDSPVQPAESSSNPASQSKFGAIVGKIENKLSALKMKPPTCSSANEDSLNQEVGGAMDIGPVDPSDAAYYAVKPQFNTGQPTTPVRCAPPPPLGPSTMPGMSPKTHSSTPFPLPSTKPKTRNPQTTCSPPLRNIPPKQPTFESTKGLPPPPVKDTPRPRPLNSSSTQPSSPANNNPRSAPVKYDNTPLLDDIDNFDLDPYSVGVHRWTCTVCTVRNNEKDYRCQVCCRQRDDAWMCIKCRVMYNIDITVCRKCSIRRCRHCTSQFADCLHACDVCDMTR